jgi:glycosyltransferase involved in cell wall biosynthesis
MPKVSVIVPVYNVEHYVGAAIQSVLEQTFQDFEILIIDDASPDQSIAVCRGFDDDRIRIIQQANRGLAGARNTGIRNAQGEYLAFLDSDDLWTADKLEKHVAHLDRYPEVGLSYCRSAFIDQKGEPLHYHQMPKLKDITPVHLLCRNPVGNGSAPVIRKQTLDAIQFMDDLHGSPEVCYFDEHLRQSEDIECWLRIALKTNWILEGLPEPLTLYRVNVGGLSASLFKQLASWEKVIEKTHGYAPRLIDQWGSLARAYQLRYLSRRAVQLRDAKLAIKLIHEAISTDLRIVLQEPQRTGLTLLAAWVLALVPSGFFQRLEAFGMRRVEKSQQRVIANGRT